MESEDKNVGITFTDTRSDAKSRFDKYARLSRHIRKRSGQEVLFVGKDNGEIENIQGQYTNTLTARYAESQSRGSYIVENKQQTQKLNQIGEIGNGQAERIYDINGLASCLSSCGGGLGAKTGLYAIPNEETEQKIITHSMYPRSSKTNKGGTGHLTKDDGTAYCLDTGCSQVIEIPEIRAIKTQRTEESKQIRKQSMKIGKDWCPRQGKELLLREDSLMNTLTASPEINNTVSDETMQNIRRLTPLEAERLQAFEDNWTKYGIDGNEIPDTQRYKCIGNAVTVSVISAIIRELYKNRMN